MTMKVKKYAIAIMAAMIMIMAFIGYSMTNVETAVAATSENETSDVMNVCDTVSRVKVNNSNVSVSMEEGNL